MEEFKGSVPDRLKMVGRGLDSWFKRIKREKNLSMKDLRNRLESLNAAAPDDDVLSEITDVNLAMNLEADREELYWEQRASANWLKHYDRNTGFFHRYASNRRRSKKISSLTSDAGVVCDVEGEIHSLARDYFNSLFTSQGVSDSTIILEGVHQSITESMNMEISRSYTFEEMAIAVRSMGPLKASGEDDLGSIFYQHFWRTVGNYILDYCIGVFRGDWPVPEINKIHIVLIPKVSNPTRMIHFRPNSLCNDLYKIIEKMVANRLQGVLHLCIDEAQSAFVPGRLIRITL